MTLVTPKEEVEWKSEWFLRSKIFFRSKFKVEWENGVWTKIRFLASGFLFTCDNFTLIFTVFRCFDLDFYLIGFPNPFIGHFSSSFLLSQWKFLELYVRTCPAMFFYFVVKILVTNIWHRKHFTSAFCSFVQAISTELRACCHFSLLVERAFLFIRVIKILVTVDLPHAQKWLAYLEIDFYLL